MTFSPELRIRVEMTWIRIRHNENHPYWTTMIRIRNPGFYIAICLILLVKCNGGMVVPIYGNVFLRISETLLQNPKCSDTMNIDYICELDQTV